MYPWQVCGGGSSEPEKDPRRSVSLSKALGASGSSSPEDGGAAGRPSRQLARTLGVAASSVRRAVLARQGATLAEPPPSPPTPFLIAGTSFLSKNQYSCLTFNTRPPPFLAKHDAHSPRGGPSPGAPSHAPAIQRDAAVDVDNVQTAPTNPNPTPTPTPPPPPPPRKHSVASTA
jgi:hypothetical protein